MPPPGGPDVTGVPGNSTGARWGIAASWTTFTAALQGSQPASLLTGNSFDVQDGYFRIFADLPMSAGSHAALRLRPFVGLRILSGRIGQVTLGELQSLSPGIAAIIKESRERLDNAAAEIDTPDVGTIPNAQKSVDEASRTAATVAKDIAARGDDLLGEIIVNEVSLLDIGIDFGVALVATGPAFSVGEATDLELIRFSIGGLGHLSGTRLTVMRGDHAQEESLVSGGVGLTMTLALCTIRAKDGIELQPLAVEVSLFSLFADTGLHLLAAQAALMWEATFPF
ncbi:MAG: hypothetical protein HY543_06295 [Deltaproteobacteria bacterium]|nr:hypothetical protein [Deltaproteobacteria bacterium]